MKILIASITDSGIKRVRSELIKQLISENNEIIVVTPQGSAYSSLEEMGCEFIPLEIQAHGTNPAKDLQLYFKYRRLLKDIKPDIVLSFTIKPNIYCGLACRTLKIPCVMNITGLGTALCKEGFLQKVIIGMYKLATGGNNQKRIFFQNKNNLEFFKKHKISREYIYHLIPGSGVNLNNYSVLEFPKNDDIHFLFIARVLKEKGIDEYLEAAQIIRKKYSNVHFHILGACNKEYESVVANANRNGIIQYHGLVNNVADYHRMSQCTIHPSYYPEGMSNVILEAAASGRPVITTDHPGCREGVDDGKNGYIIKPRDTASLVNAIERFVALSVGEREAMGLYGRNKIEKEFNREIVTNAYLNIIEKVSKESR